MSAHLIHGVTRIRNPYSKRILSNVIGRDPLTVLASTPARLRRLIRSLTDHQLRTPAAKGKWSIVQIVSHLADAEVVLSFRLRMAIAQSGSPLQAFDQNMWERGLDYRKARVRHKLDLLTSLRSDNVNLLRSLPPRGWQRYGMHEERGRETVERIAQMHAGHDLNHLKQISLIRKSLKKPTK